MTSSSNFPFDPSKLKGGAADYSSSESDGDGDDDFLMPSRNANESEFADHNPRKRRRTGRDNKESAALGIFGSDSEDDTRFKRKNLRNKGMSFVPSGTKGQASDEDEDDVDEEALEEEYADVKDGSTTTMNPWATREEDEDEDEALSGIGLGFLGAAAAPSLGLGWAPPTQQQMSFRDADTPSKPAKKSTFNSRAPLGSSFTPSSAAAPELKVKYDEPEMTRTSMPSAFSQGRGGKIKLNKKSFAAKMMEKMGYVEGQGLGKEGQGRNVIIEANLRPQGVGLGAVKEKSEQERQEEKRQQRMRGERVVDSDEEDKKKKAARKKKSQFGGISSGTASGASTPKRQKPKYFTMDEVKKVAPGLNIPEAFTPILDMTGPGQKLLMSSSGIMTPTSRAAAAESIEDAESRKLTRRAQNDFMAILEEWQSLQERKAFVELQLQQERQEMEELASVLQANKGIANVCAELALLPESGELDKKADVLYKLRHVISGLKVANDGLPKTVLPRVKEELALLAVAAIHPFFKDYMDIWEPLTEPKPRFVEGMVSITSLLGLGQEHKRCVATPFEAMMYKYWLPVVAAAVRGWNVRDSDQLLALFEAWRPLMPAFVRHQLLTDIERKLEEALRSWEPKRKKHSVLPHFWIFPWLQYLPSHHLDPTSSTGLVSDIRRKFRQLIDVWEFKLGLISGLKEMKQLLRPSKSCDQWTPLVMNHLLPSMARYLRTAFRVDPQDQEPYLDVLEGIFKWLDVISPSMVGEVIVAELFPKWHDTLYQWLTGDDANYEEIGQWFQWWEESVFPDEIKSLPSVAAEFEKGTKLIEDALNLGDDVKKSLKAPKKGPALRSEKPAKEKHHHKHHHRNHEEPAVPEKQPEEVTFRHVIEDWCQENDLQFIPERKKVHAEGPLYRITARGDGKGGVLVYFKGDSLFAERKGVTEQFRRDEESDWSSLQELAS